VFIISTSQRADGAPGSVTPDTATVRLIGDTRFTFGLLTHAMLLICTVCTILVQAW